MILKILQSRILQSVLACSMMMFSAPRGYAQQSSGPRRQLATIIYSGLGGAVLGLSTLSFYGRPQEKLSNIAVGFAVGVIASTVYVTYEAATKPSRFYGLNVLPTETLQLADITRHASHIVDFNPLKLQWDWSF